MTNFWWVRHGPTHEKTFVGWRDVPADLSDTQLLQRLHDYLPDEALVISSDLDRSIKTADAIQGSRHRLPHDPDLREMHFGEWDGKHFTEVENSHPDLSRAFWETPGSIAAPGGESWFDAENRVAKAVERLQQRQASDVIVVAHFGVILTQLRLADGVMPQEILAQDIDNLSVTRITSDGQTGPINHLP